MSGVRRRALVCAAALAMSAIGCSSDSDDQLAEEQAQEVLRRTNELGIFPRLTPEIVEALYDTDADAVCGAFDGGLSTAASNLLLGNPALGRRRAITARSVIYTGLVIETYCPEVLSDFRAAIEDVDPLEDDR